MSIKINNAIEILPYSGIVIGIARFGVVYEDICPPEWEIAIPFFLIVIKETPKLSRFLYRAFGI